tara:strand:+ start:300 stop:521 length:222 start_codon:yes stop_codon:yes gene_type:complete
MPKYIVKEGILTKLMQSVFKLAATGDERKALKTALGKDPVMKKNIQALAKIRKDIQKRVNADPTLKKHFDRLG